VPGNAPYYFWFSLVRATPGGRVHAEMWMPERSDLRALLTEIGVASRPPAMVEMPADGAHGPRVYFAGDFGETDFDPGDHRSAGRIERESERLALMKEVSSAPLFWRFYAPVMSQIVRELASQQSR
jgi:hypothetical protein